MDNAKVLGENAGGGKRPLPAGPEPRSLLGWVRKKLRRIARRRKKDKDIEIYPLF